MCSFIETRLFTRLVSVRKLRWRAAGRGKSGGYRVIYFVRPAQGVIWMLTIYPKNVAENIPAHVLRQIRKEVGDA
jgi:mRNA-degrading endonuclease RelE of RelBE toxin-antitoxin system